MMSLYSKPVFRALKTSRTSNYDVSHSKVTTRSDGMIIVWVTSDVISKVTMTPVIVK